MLFPVYNESADFFDIIDKVASPKHRRRFGLIRVHSTEHRSEVEKLAKQRGLIVLPGTPVWLVLVTHNDVPWNEAREVQRVIMDKERLEHIDVLGTAFGYPKEHVEWYKAELRKAMTRFDIWLS